MGTEVIRDFQGVAAIPGPTKVNGVRVYIDKVNTVVGQDESVFYSRRGDGPFYRWLFEQNGAKWRVARVVDSGFSRQTLSLATWKTIPVALQTRLGEHYLE